MEDDLTLDDDASTINDEDPQENVENVPQDEKEEVT